MKSRRASRFRRLFERLPEEVQRQATEAFARWMQNPGHPGLAFKKVDIEHNIWSIRIGRDYRALCVKTEEGTESCYIWFWIGPHEEYDRLISG